MKRRDVLLLGASALTVAVARRARAQQPAEVKVALIMPLSGAWARSGELSRKGADMAIDDINRDGGIKALGGAKLKLIVADCGDSPETAKTAAQRLLAQHSDLVGGVGAYVSSFTLAITEVTERGEVPWLTLAYADALTNRGFKYIFQTSPTADQQAAAAMPTILQLAQSTTGSKPTKMGIVMDNTPSPVSFTKNMRGPALEKLGLKLVVDETFTPPLSDAGPIVGRVRAARPDFLLFLPTNAPDIKLILEKLTEMGLTRARLPVISNGGPMGSPDLLKIAGKNIMEGVMFIVANWGAKGLEDLINRFKQRTGEPWITQDSISTYGHYWILKEALERASSTDRHKVNEMLHTMNLTDGAARFFAGGRVKFAENGRREGAPLVIVQWQNGEPVSVYPPETAFAKPIWTKQ
jgi:branched-chain amino acid transport system substrate-binding protein